MGQTYDATLPTDRDRARAILGATDVSSAEAGLISDEHIDAVLIWQSGLDAGVSFLASELAARYAQLPSSVSDNGTSVAWAERVRYWLTLANRGSATGTGGGLSFVPVTYTTVVVGDEFSRPLDCQL